MTRVNKVEEPCIFEYYFNMDLVYLVETIKRLKRLDCKNQPGLIQIRGIQAWCIIFIEHTVIGLGTIVT